MASFIRKEGSVGTVSVWERHRDVSRGVRQPHWVGLVGGRCFRVVFGDKWERLDRLGVLEELDVCNDISPGG